jgi:hypothetical protein
MNGTARLATIRHPQDSIGGRWLSIDCTQLDPPARQQ